MGAELVTFNYKDLDTETANYLRQKETNMREIVSKAYTELGKELKEAQDKLAKNGYGCFQEWLESIGMKKQTSYKLIQRYELIVHNVDEQDLLEDLPVSLTYEIAKPSAESTPERVQAKQAVLNGEVKTLKEYNELLKKLNELEQSLEKERNKPTQIETKIIEKEVDRTDYETIEKLQAKLNKAIEQKESYQEWAEMYEKEANEYKKLKEEINHIHSEKDDVKRQIDSAASLGSLYAEIEFFLQNKLAPVKYSRAILERKDSPTVIKNLTEIIGMVELWTDEMKSYLPNNNIIDVEIID